MYQTAAIFQLHNGIPSDSPIHVSKRALCSTGLAAQQHHHRLSLGGDETQHKDILDSTSIALQHSVPHQAILVKAHLLLHTNTNTDNIMDNK